MSRFAYLIEKVARAPKTRDPFEHIYIDDFFSEADFAEIVGTPEINIPAAVNDDDLFSKLYASGYKVIQFPGCTEDQDSYTRWHKNKQRDGFRFQSSCEGFGMTLRLTRPTSGVLAELDEFLASTAFNQAIAERFGIDLGDCSIDGGIQKYLDGYEISPHPDIRRKAATFMVNINPHANSEEIAHHTHYLTMKPGYDYVRRFWEENADIDRCWVPWDWCETKAMQPKNNSIVLFSPSNRTVHGVKADYDHLAGQRTQLYGNLWYKKAPILRNVSWEELEGGAEAISLAPEKLTTAVLARKMLPKNLHAVARKLKQSTSRTSATHQGRRY